MALSNGHTPVSAFSVYKVTGSKKRKNKETLLSPNELPIKKEKKHKTKLSNNAESILIKKKSKSTKTSYKTHETNKPVTKKSLAKKQKGKSNLNDLKTKKKISNEEIAPTLIPIETNSDLSEPASNSNQIDPTPEVLKLFKWLIAPLKPKEFLEKYWETEAFHQQRNSGDYYKCILTTERLDSVFREHPLYYTRNVDVVSYENGVKEVHNEEGRVVASALYDYYSNGCSIRILNPQTYVQKVHYLITALQEYFGSMVGVNVYLTPAGSQGFAPHYDDIEAFVLQLEGRKHWKLYKPKGSDVLARDSSANLKHEDIGEPFMEATLNAGDLLYFPRGTIHEARTDSEAHSLHITVSVYQRNSYADLLEHILPKALQEASLNNVEFRKGLPLNYLKYSGFVNRGLKSEKRKSLIENVNKLIDTLKEYVNVDLAADALGRRLMYDSMPPFLSTEEANFTSKYDGDFMQDGKIVNRIEIGMDTQIRLVRFYCLRLVVDGDSAKIYYSTENAKYYHGEEEQFLSIDLGLVPCIKKLQRMYPNYIEVEDLPIEDGVAKAQLVSDLWERGLLVTNGPLPLAFGDDDDHDDGSFELVE
ncbi:unnamed protein product [Phyllotreta striolata]|uniref:Bifunctional lysine-specific demethylase and histidyl-hydroxylase n=1 Tax=Phyllotreta striolata TaxID=444603 RepID=A0A9N9TZ33_PHYSR|nr:unnamed protein product [Phyllotreta striolata]